MQETIITLYLLGGAAALGGVLILMGYGVRYAAGKVPWEAGQRVILRFWDNVGIVAREANAEMQAKLELARHIDSPGGVVITSEEWEEAKRSTLAKLKRIYSQEMLKKIAEELGISFDALDQQVVSAITGALKVPTLGPL